MAKKEEDQVLKPDHYEQNDKGEWVRVDSTDTRTLAQKLLAGFLKPNEVPVGGEAYTRKG